MQSSVQNIVRNALSSQCLAKHLRFIDRSCTHQNRLVLGVCFFDLFDHRFVFFTLRAVHAVVFINPCNAAIGWYFNHTQTVDFGKFFCFSRRGTCHARKRVVQTEVVLECHRCQGHILGLDVYIFLSFNSLVQTIRQTTARHHSTCKFVDQYDFIVTYDVIFIALEQLVRTQTLVDVVNQASAFGIIKRRISFQQTTGAQLFFKELVSIISKGHVAGFFIQFKVVVS